MPQVSIVRFDVRRASVGLETVIPTGSVADRHAFDRNSPDGGALARCKSIASKIETMLAQSLPKTVSGTRRSGWRSGSI